MDTVGSKGLGEVELPVRIRELRIAKDLTLDQLSDLVGVSTPHLSEVERGKKNLNNHLLVRIADALDVKPSDIISSDDMTPFAALYYELSKLDDVDQARVREFIRALRQSKQDDEDDELNAICDARQGEAPIEVDIDEL